MSFGALEQLKHQFYIPQTTGDLDQDPNQTDFNISIEVGEPEGLEEPEGADYAQTMGVIGEPADLIPESMKNYSSSVPEVDELQYPGLVQPFMQNETVSMKIEKIHQGNFTNCFDRPRHNFAKGAQELAKDEIEQLLKINYRKNSDGVVEMVNKIHLKKQKQVLGHLAKQFGSAIFSGKSINGLSLPVSIFEPRSNLERQATGLAYAPFFLEQGGNTTNTYEQFKLAVTHFVTTCHLLVNPQKPFNPIVGETFQGMIGGCPIYMEQISHHPAVSAYQMLGKNFTIEGTTEFTASLSANSVKSGKNGHLNVIFKNTNAVVKAQYPTVVMHGTTIGKRTFQFSGISYIFDLENKYYAEVDFDRSSSYVSKKKSKTSKDTFVGGIWKVNDGFIQIIKQDLEKNKMLNLKFKEKDHAVARLDTLEGTWMEYLKLGERTVWNFGNPWPYKLQYLDDALPSDSNYRLDILHLRAGDEGRAQEYKKLLEDQQRYDRKLRDQVRGKGRK